MPIEDREDNLFELRYNKSTSMYYYFNPYTGEVLPEATEENGGGIIRSHSLWAPHDVIKPKDHAHLKVDTLTQYLPVQYASRGWGARNYKWTNENKNSAATIIKAVYRGHIARRKIQEYYKLHIEKILDKSTGYYFYSHKETGETSWYKPRLALPKTILVEDPYKHRLPHYLNPKTYMKSTGKLKFSTNNNNMQDQEAELDAMDEHGNQFDELMNKKVPSLSKEFAGTNLPTYTPTCITECSFGWPYTVIRSWFDRYAASLDSCQEYVKLSNKNSWEELTELMQDAIDKAGNNILDTGETNTFELVRAHITFGLHCMTTKLYIDDPNDDEAKTKENCKGAMKAITLLIHWMERYCNVNNINKDHNKYINKFFTLVFSESMFECFYFSALEILLEHIGCRHHFFATPDVDMLWGGFGPSWEKAKEDAILMRMKCIISLLQDLPSEKVDHHPHKKAHADTSSSSDSDDENKKDDDDLKAKIKYDPVVLDVVELIVISFGILARDRGHRELVSLACADTIVELMPNVMNEVSIIIQCLRTLYNCCFMSELGQYAVLGTEKIHRLINVIRQGNTGRDRDVARECIRLELALEEDGWRGKVEERMSDDLQMRHIQSRLRSRQAKGGESSESFFSSSNPFARGSTRGKVIGSILGSGSNTANGKRTTTTATRRLRQQKMLTTINDADDDSLLHQYSYMKES